MYGKLFASTFTGSLYGAGPVVYSVWAYVIANTSYDGRVELNPRMLAGIIGTNVEEIRTAITYLCSPDADSRSKKHGGARLLREGEYQYFVVNYLEYRSIRNADERREYNRLKKREERDRKRLLSPNYTSGQEKTVNSNVNDMSMTSLTINDMSALSAHVEVEEEVEVYINKVEEKRVGGMGEERSSVETRSRSSRPTPTKKKVTDEEWFESLKTNPAYKHINFEVEMGKLDAWLSKPENKGKTKNHSRILNWLNKCERPVSLSTHNPSPKSNPKPSLEFHSPSSLAYENGDRVSVSQLDPDIQAKIKSISSGMSITPSKNKHTPNSPVLGG